MSRHTFEPARVLRSLPFSRDNTPGGTQHDPAHATVRQVVGVLPPRPRRRRVGDVVRRRPRHAAAPPPPPAGAAAAGCPPPPRAPPPPPAPPPARAGPVAVEVAVPRAGGIDRVCVQPGTIEPAESAELYAKVAGYLAEQDIEVDG